MSTDSSAAAADAADDVFDALKPADEANVDAGGAGSASDCVPSDDEFPDGPGAGAPARNALEHSIRKRGANSYYYAHAGPTGAGRCVRRRAIQLPVTVVAQQRSDGAGCVR